MIVIKDVESHGGVSWSGWGEVGDGPFFVEGRLPFMWLQGGRLLDIRDDDGVHSSLSSVAVHCLDVGAQEFCQYLVVPADEAARLSPGRVGVEDGKVEGDG